MSLCVYVCIYSYEQWNMLFIIHILKESSSLHVFFWQKVGLFIHYSYYTWKKAVHLQYPFSLLMSQCYTFTLSPSFVRDNACKSNADLKVNLEEYIKEIYSEKNWMALLIQRWLMALVNPAVAVGVCVLTDTTLENWTEAGTCLGALVPAFHFLLWQLLKNAV